jgi:hypothetical protein
MAVLVMMMVLSAHLTMATGQSLWKDSYDLSEDRDRLARGDNLLYAVAGSETYLTNTMDTILSTFQSACAKDSTKNVGVALQVVDLQCMDLATVASPLRQFEEFTRDKKLKTTPAATEDPSYQWTDIFVVYNVESLTTPAELKKLDFLFRVTDKSFEYANVAVVLLWNSDIRPLPVGDDMKQRLASAWAAGAPLVNGDALSGRVARTVSSLLLIDRSPQMVSTVCQYACISV